MPAQCVDVSQSSEVERFCLPPETMSFPTKAARVWLAGILLGMAVPARGQITALVDERGKRVFINESIEVRNRANRAPVRAAAAARTAARGDLERLVHEAAERHRVDPALIRAVIHAESNWNPQAVSSKGAQGLMQLIPGTAEALGVQDPFDPAQNLEGGVRHLRALLEKYDGDLDKALAAYNAGAGAVDRAGGVPNYPETQSYVQKITDSYFRPDSGRSAQPFTRARQIYRAVDSRGRVVFTNE